MQTTCLNCGHVWDYKGKLATPRCPKCAKKIKKKDFAEQLRNMEKKEQEEPEAESKETSGTMLMQKEKGKDTSGPAITVKQVDITPPPGLDQPALTKEVKKGDEKKKPPIKVDIPHKTVEIFTNVPFNFWAELEGENDYKLTRTESGSLVPMVKRFLDKNMGIWFEKYAEEFALAFILATVIGKRVIMKLSRDKEKKELKKPEVPTTETPELYNPRVTPSGEKIKSAFDVGADQEKNPVKKQKKGGA